MDDVVRGLAKIIEPVRVDFHWRPQLRDPDDEMVLETAINGQGEVIVTHNYLDFGVVPEQFRIALMRPGSILKTRFRDGYQ